MVKVKTVVELDLVGYSKLGRTLQENLGVEVVARFNEQIQGFVDKALTAAGKSRSEVVKATTGDGAILAFDSCATANDFAIALHLAADEHNAGVSTPAAHRWFRVGIATGDLNEAEREGGGHEISGMVVVDAVRLEAAARGGQILVDRATFNCLPPGLQALFGKEEVVAGKHDEEFRVHRAIVVPYTATEKSSAVQSVEAPTIPLLLELFDQLNPRDQLTTVMQIIRMPIAHRPLGATLANQQAAILDWADGYGGCGLIKLSEALKFLIQRQGAGFRKIIAPPDPEPLVSASDQAERRRQYDRIAQALPPGANIVDIQAKDEPHAQRPGVRVTKIVIVLETIVPEGLPAESWEPGGANAEAERWETPSSEDEGPFIFKWPGDLPGQD